MSGFNLKGTLPRKLVFGATLLILTYQIYYMLNHPPYRDDFNINMYTFFIRISCILLLLVNIFGVKNSVVQKSLVLSLTLLILLTISNDISFLFRLMSVSASPLNFIIYILFIAGPYVSLLVLIREPGKTVDFSDQIKAWREKGPQSVFRVKVVPNYGSTIFHFVILAVFIGFALALFYDPSRTSPDNAKLFGVIVPIFLAGIFWIMFAGGGIINFLHQKMKRPAIRHMIVDAFQRASLSTPSPIFADLGGVSKKQSLLSGTGITRDGDNLLVVDGGELAVIPWNLVRSWTWEIAGRTVYRQFGFNQTQANLANLEEGVKQNRNSGLFITVKDTDKPVWQVMTKDKDIINQWDEILTQISEAHSGR